MTNAIRRSEWRESGDPYIARNVYSDPAYGCAPGGALVPFLDSITLSGAGAWAAYSFQYLYLGSGDPVGNQAGALSRLTLPTGGSISYTYGVTAVKRGVDSKGCPNNEVDDLVPGQAMRSHQAVGASTVSSST